GNYLWSTSATTSTISVSPTSTAVYTVTGNNSGCTSTNTATVTVSPNPTVTVNSAAICAGASATLTATGASTFLWSTSATTSTISVSPASTTVYTVTGTIAGCSDIKTVTVNVTATPTITATATSGTICVGQSTTLIGSGATNYTWMPGGANSSNVNVNPSIGTTYTVTGANGVCASTQTVAVNVNALPTVSFTQNPNVLCINHASITLSPGTPMGGTYSGAGVTGNTFNPSTAGTGTFVITYSYTNVNNCTNTAAQNMVINACTGINQLATNNDQVTVYPNPNNGNFIVETSTTEAQTVQLFDLNGSLVLSQNINSKASIDASNLQNGVYYISIHSKEGVVNKKLIIVR
ncbi:MAG TPA: T9SS type A sorting domain-containing protein, partial [Bacteroidia bacterium]